MGAFPLMLIPLAAYVMAAFLAYDATAYVPEPGTVALHPFWDEAVASFTLVSGRYWSITWGDLLLLLALALLLVSVLGAASTRSSTVLGNMVRVLVLCVYIVMFLTLDFAGTTVFFLLTAIALAETLATVSVSVVAAQADLEAIPED